jgi:hypothetical protein
MTGSGSSFAGEVPGSAHPMVFIAGEREKAPAGCMTFIMEAAELGASCFTTMGGLACPS